MAPPKPPEEERSSDESSASSTPAKRKSSANNTPTSGKRKPTPTSTPRRPTLNGPRTPAGKAIGNRNGTPNSAPVRKPSKAPEPTLLTDFLLGRPSPHRVRNGGPTRRKSLDLVKAEMRADNMARVQAPGKVHDRVKQWQKANAAARAQDATADTDEINAEAEKSSDDETVGEENRPKRNNSGRKPGRRKSKTPEEEPPGPVKNRPKQTVAEPPLKHKNAAPKKRVISDSHWMNKKIQAEKRNTIPKNFLQATALNPPLEKKIEDWVKRTEPGNHQPAVEKKAPKMRKPRKSESEGSDPEPRSRKSSRQRLPDDGVRIKPSNDTLEHDGIRVTPLRDTPADDGIRIKPSKDRPDDGIRVTPSKSVRDNARTRTKHTPTNFPDDGIRIKPSRDNSPLTDSEAKPAKRNGSRQSQRRQKEQDAESAAPSRRSTTHLKPPSEAPSRRASSHGSKRHDEDDDNTSWASPSPPEGSRNGHKRAATPPESLDEIPFGNSAFSVLELPLGAEAGNIKRPPPKRNPSFMVPKVLKKVYNDIVHDNAEPPRGGPNQPRSIESWLNSTGDPFVDRPAPPASVLDIPDSSSEDKRDSNADDQTEKNLAPERDDGHEASHSKHAPYAGKDDEPAQSPISNPKNRSTTPSMENSPPLSPSGLKRSPATRNVSSSKPGRKIPFKQAIFGAFQGESAMKGPTPSPYDYIGMRERDLNRVSSITRSEEPESKVDHAIPKVSPRIPEKAAFEPAKKEDKPLPTFPKRLAPTIGAHRLSTIASVETFSASSSLSQTASELSETTVTQDTILTAPTGSSLSRKSKKSTSQNNGLKRRLTKHSDLMSMLSLPDTTQPGRTTSIRSARSVRTTRTNLETATVQDLMKELAEDETKYIRELNTLVDGVIPVLLTSVLSKSDAAIAAGLFDPFGNADHGTFTRPIVDMGVALEKLKILHKRINLTSPDYFLYWAQSAHKAYEDYLRAWRSGFEDIVVNLAPASDSAEWEPTIDEMDRNADGDVVTDSGERVDVAYLLKRPCVRVKKLAKATKGLAVKMPNSKLAKETDESYQDLERFSRDRATQEAARRVDLKAINTDASRARNPATLEPEESVTISRTYLVFAKDLFTFDMHHSSGQKMVCEVELILRESPDKSVGDLLICERTDSSFFLLFPPQNRSLLSARFGDNKNQIVVLMRGFPVEWQETFVLEVDDAETAADWVGWLGQSPIPPPITSKKMELDPSLASVISAPDLDTKSVVGALKTIPENDIPIGECRQESMAITLTSSTKKTPSRYHQRPSRSVPQSPKNRYSTCVAHVHKNLRPEQIENMMDPADVGVLDIEQIDRELRRSGKPLTPPAKRVSSADIYDPEIGGNETEEYTGQVEMSGANPDAVTITPNETYQSTKPSTTPMGETRDHESSIEGIQLTILEKEESTEPIIHDEAPPPPPAHKSPVSSELSKKTPVLDPATPRTRNRRTSSPLKHEWQPSDASGTSSASEESESTDDSYTDESSSSEEYDEEDDEDELEPSAIPRNFPAGVSLHGKKVSPDGSVYTAETSSSLAPSNSASQGPYKAALVTNDKTTQKFVAMVSYWHRSQWMDLCADPCSITVTPGHIEVFRINSSHSDSETGSTLPMVEQVLVPWASLRQSTALDVEIGSPPTARSQLTKLKEKTKIFQFRYRALNTNDGYALYAACHHSRMNNPKVLEMQRQNAFNNFGNDAYENAVAANRRRSIFGIKLGRKNSYRASARAPSDYDSNPSGRSSNSAISALRRMTGGGRSYNIARSTVDLHGHSNPSSGPQSMYSSDSGFASSRTPNIPSIAGGSSMYSNGLTVRDIGFENIQIQLYSLLNGTTWNDCGKAYFTCVAPPRGMRQQSTLDHGPQKRIIVSRKPMNGSNIDEKGNKIIVFVDAVLGRDCFKKQGRVGVICSIWEDLVGDDGRVGSARAYGGVGARTRVWAFQLARAGDCEWVYQLCTSGQGR